MNNWQDTAARRFLALADMLMLDKVTLNQVPVIMLHNFYLITSWLYYEVNEEVIRDTKYDEICNYIKDNFMTFFMAPIWHKEKTLQYERFAAGTGFDLEYPRQIKEIGFEMLRLLSIGGVKLQWQG